MQASTTSEWEKVSRDTFRWTELMEQLERLAILAAVLSIPPLPLLPRNKNLTRNLHFSCQPQRFSPFKKSLNDILSQGKGIFYNIIIICTRESHFSLINAIVTHSELNEISLFSINYINYSQYVI